MHVTAQDMGYDMIIGGDLLTKLKIDISYSQMAINWEGSTVPVKDKDVAMEESMHIED